MCNNDGQLTLPNEHVPTAMIIPPVVSERSEAALTGLLIDRTIRLLADGPKPIRPPLAGPKYHLCGFEPLRRDAEMSRLLALRAIGVLVGTKCLPVDASNQRLRVLRALCGAMLCFWTTAGFIWDMCFRGRDAMVSNAVAYDRLMFATYATSGLPSVRCGGTTNGTSRRPIRLG
jgi:hypothetical protein